MNKELHDTLLRKYVTSDLTINALLPESGMSRPAFYRLTKLEKWADQRKAYRLEHPELHFKEAPVYNWPAIEAEYITGSASYRELANKYGYSRHSIIAHGNQGKWSEKRLAYRATLGDSAADPLSPTFPVRRTRVDWDAVCKEYITGSMSINDLAAEHHVSAGRVGVYIKRNNCVERRAAYRKQCVISAVDAVLRDQVEAIRSLVPALNCSVDDITDSIQSLRQLPGLKLDEQMKTSQILRNLEPIQRILSGRLTPEGQLRKDALAAANTEESFHVEFGPDVEELAK